MESVYIETTIISYLVRRPSKDPLLAAHQQVTKEWWTVRRPRFRCVTSTEVQEEAARGEAGMARMRAAALQELVVITIDEEMDALARQFLQTGALPQSMGSDALHLAVAVLADVDYLLTWNCRHLANAQILRRLEREAIRRGKPLPTVCTPLELTGESPDVQQ